MTILKKKIEKKILFGKPEICYLFLKSMQNSQHRSVPIYNLLNVTLKYFCVNKSHYGSTFPQDQDEQILVPQ